jgi:hypothetical protein
MNSNENKILIKILSFTGLAIAANIELKKTNHAIYQNPFILGAIAMVVAQILEYCDPSVNYTYVVMYFFIFTKLITQYTYSQSYNIFGMKLK